MAKARTRRLEARALKFAQAIAAGHSQIAAWKQATPDWQKFEKDDDSNYLHKRAYEFSRDPIVERIVTDHLKSVKVAAMDSHAAAHAHTIQREREAFESGNSTAASQYQRLRMQSLGVLTNNLAVTDHGVSTNELLRRVEALSPEAAAALRIVYGLSDTDAAQPNGKLEQQ